MLLAGFLLYLPHAVASIYYVSAGSGNDANDGVSWDSPMQTIQAAVDAASNDDTVLVSNGVYNMGSRSLESSFPYDESGMSRLVIDKALTVQSVNGPSNTYIVGQGPLGTNAVRCVLMGEGAVLSGFTLSSGFTSTNGPFIGFSPYGGAVCNISTASVLTNCVLTGCSATFGGGAYYGTLNNCNLISNSATWGGGSCYGTLSNCTLVGNSATDGGGSYDGTLSYCTLIGNSATNGGGSYDGTLSNCTLIGNSAVSGGGVFTGILNRCAMIGNSATNGGGAYYGTLNNCILSNNAACEGGGSFWSTLNNCTMTGNSATNSGGGALESQMYSCLLVGNSADTGGGARGGHAYNCTIIANTGKWGGAVYEVIVDNSIIYSNNAPSGEHLFSVFHFSCGPQLPIGNGNITNRPIFIAEGAGNYRLLSSSPCINTGTNIMWMAGKLDLDGNLRILDGLVDMGAYEFLDNPSIDTDGDGMPDWWEELYGLNSSVSNVAGSDADVDDVPDEQEFIAGTNPTNPNSDGDQYDDGVEVQSGMNPTSDDSDFYSPILSNPALFGLYTSNSVGDLSFGGVMLAVSNGILKVELGMEQANYLSGDWTNVGPPLMWETPATGDVYFYRFIGN